MILQIQPKYRLHLADISGNISASDQVAETCDACDRKEDLWAFLFLYKNTWRKICKKKPIKPFITYSDQINILTQKKTT